MDVKVSRPGGRSARVRRTVLDAALSCLDDGLTSVSLREIADRASVAPSSLSRRWGSAEQLMAEALLEQSQVSVPVPDTGSVRSDLITFAQGLAAYLSSPRGRAVVRTMAAVEWTDELDAARERFWTERFAASGVIVQRGIDRGELDPSIDPRLLLEMVVAPLHLRRHLIGQDPTALIAQQVDLLLAGSRRRP